MGRTFTIIMPFFWDSMTLFRPDVSSLSWLPNVPTKYLNLNDSHLRGACLFLFGSVDSMIHSEEGLFESLNHFPFSTYINVGLESNDPKTLEALKKPVSVEKVREAFTRILDINRRYEKIEVTSNFVFGEDLPSGHLPSLLELTRNRVNLIQQQRGCLPVSAHGRRNAEKRKAKESY